VKNEERPDDVVATFAARWHRTVSVQNNDWRRLRIEGQAFGFISNLLISLVIVLKQKSKIRERNR